MTHGTVTAQPPAVGDRAPAFSLESTTRETVSLEDFRGRKHVLLAFFPLAFTSTCTAELCGFRDDFDQFASADVVVLPISVDSSATLAEFKRKYDMKAELLSDFRRTASRDYGVLMEETFFSARAYFLVDRDGIVRWSYIEDTPGTRRENSEILEAIAGLR